MTGKSKLMVGAAAIAMLAAASTAEAATAQTNAGTAQPANNYVQMAQADMPPSNAELSRRLDAIEEEVQTSEMNAAKAHLLLGDAGVPVPPYAVVRDINAIPPTALCKAIIRMRRLTCNNSSTFCSELSIMTAPAASAVTSLLWPKAIPTVHVLSAHARVISLRWLSSPAVACAPNGRLCVKP